MKIFVACHDRIPSFLDGELFIPVQSGTMLSEMKLPCIHDDDKEPNISGRNSVYNELCAFQYASQHLVDDEKACYGFMQGKRYLLNSYDFMRENQRSPFCLNENELSPIVLERMKYCDSDLDGYDMIAPCPQRVYCARGSLYENWCVCHDGNFVKEAYNACKTMYPDCAKSFETVFFGKLQFYIYHNIFISRGDVFREYGKWLIDILTEMEKHVQLNRMTDRHYLFLDHKYKPMAWLAEHLMNVYVLWRRLMVKYNYVLQIQ